MDNAAIQPSRNPSTAISRRSDTALTRPPRDTPPTDVIATSDPRHRPEPPPCAPSRPPMPTDDATHDNRTGPQLPISVDVSAPHEPRPRGPTTHHPAHNHSLEDGRQAQRVDPPTGMVGKRCRSRRRTRTHRGAHPPVSGEARLNHRHTDEQPTHGARPRVSEEARTSHARTGPDPIAARTPRPREPHPRPPTNPASMATGNRGSAQRAGRPHAACEAHREPTAARTHGAHPRVS